jgi:hypothetical protein
MRPDGEEWCQRRLELRQERVLAQEKIKERWGIDAAVDYEAPDEFYREEEGGAMVASTRNDRQ